MITVALADDEKLFRKGLRTILDKSAQIRVLIEAGSGIELLELLQQAGTPPDVLLLDLSMPGMNGMETFEQVRTKYKQIRILILSVHYNDHYIVTLIEKGANGYLSKNTEPDELERAILTVARNDFYFNEDTIRAMHKNLSGKHKRQLLVGEGLTEREIEVLQLICQELTAVEIADRLYISKRTAEGHRNSLLLKTGCRNTAGLVIYAIRHNIFKLEKF